LARSAWYDRVDTIVVRVAYTELERRHARGKIVLRP
jgi:hypothetical protein